MRISLSKLQPYIDQKLITRQKHPTESLWIYNYSKNCQFDKKWDSITTICRGLILDAEGHIVSRCLPKFFNLEEMGPEWKMPNEKFTVTEKEDGSLGITYWVDGKPYLATRGSFTSDQAMKGTEILHKKYSHLKLDPTSTYLFEIIYPANRIVLDYKGIEDLILLAVIDTKTGEELYHNMLEVCFNHKTVFPIVKRYDGIKDITKLKELEEPNKEGFVIRFNSGLRLKCKFPDYLRLHRLITGCNARRIWDLLRSKQSINELLERVPEEFADWVKKTAEELHKCWAGEMILAEEETDKARKFSTRKEQANYILKGQMQADSGICFNLLDKKQKEAEEKAWKLVMPAHEIPFKIEI